MRVLILSQFFPPEIGATQTRVATFAQGLAERGHEVEVICQVPNHPQGVVHDGFRRRPVVHREVDGYDVRHVWVYTAPVKTTAKRLAFYGTYLALATALGSVRSRPDVILASSPPLPVALAGDLIAARHRVPWVMDVRDLWPAAAVAMGELTPGRGLEMAEALEFNLYDRAAAIIAVTEPFVEKIAAQADPAKIHLIPNGTTQFWLDAANESPDRAALGLPADEFVWTFAGNIGAAQGLDAAVDAAVLLGDGFRLLIIGNGPARPDLERRARDAGANVEFRDQMPAVEARVLLRASDALLVSLLPDPVFEDFVPSKLWDFCAVGRPVVLAVSGEAVRLAQVNEAAWCIPPGDPHELSSAIRSLRDDEQSGSALSLNGSRFARANLRDRHLGSLISILEICRL